MVIRGIKLTGKQPAAIKLTDEITLLQWFLTGMR